MCTNAGSGRGSCQAGPSKSPAGSKGPSPTLIRFEFDEIIELFRQRRREIAVCNMVLSYRGCLMVNLQEPHSGEEQAEAGGAILHQDGRLRVEAHHERHPPRAHRIARYTIRLRKPKVIMDIYICPSDRCTAEGAGMIVVTPVRFNGVFGMWKCAVFLPYKQQSARYEAGIKLGRTDTLSGGLVSTTISDLFEETKA